MRLLVILSTLAVAAASFSGCIDAAGWEEHADDWEHEAEAHAEEDEDCPDEEEAQGGSARSQDHDDVEPDEAFEDAAPRYHNEVDGSEESSRTIHVPLGTDRLRVALVHDSDGRVEFTLEDPLYRDHATEDADGTKYLFEDEWALIEDPLPGDWTLDIDIDGNSSYTVGFYLDE